MTKKCPGCGASIHDGDAVCPQCRRSVDETATRAGEWIDDSERTMASQHQDDAPTIVPAVMDGGATYAPEGDTVHTSASSAQFDTPTRVSSETTLGTGGQGRGTGPLTPGEAFGSRYHIIRVLGVGGMGAVYQAWDDELGVAVAIKTIRLADDGDPKVVEAMEKRFKRELILARQVTHPNVVRIHDLGDVDGTKYITMSYVDGEDLATILKADGKLPVARALDIMRQVVSGMRAAHAAGIVHRDLKPANIMIDDGQALIMDFGIARSMVRADVASSSVPGRSPRPQALTMAGAILGTLDYMAPEQATAQPVDQRADVYALGLILYDMVLGRSARPRTENPMTDFEARRAEPPRSPRSVDPTMPEAIDQLINRCLQPDPALRFQTSEDLLAALDVLDDQGNPKPIEVAVKPRSKWVVAAAVLVVLVSAASAWYLGRRGAAPAVIRDPLPVLIANFDNRTGDRVFDGALEQMLAVGVEGTSFITAYPRQTAQRLAGEIAPGSALDEERARLVAIREGINVVLVGRIDVDGSGYRISMRTVDPAKPEPLGTLEERASSKDDVIEAVNTLATGLRRQLGDFDATDVLQAETFTAGSLEAARAYSIGEELLAGGRSEEAMTRFSEAVAADGNFGRAYAGLGNAAFRLGRAEEAEAHFKKALGLMERMSEREKFRTLGSYYLGPGANYEQAVNNYESLAEKYPADGAGLSNLAVAHFSMLNFKKAEEQGQRATAIYPNNQTFRANLALYAMYATDLERAVAESKSVIERGPRDLAYLPIAIAALDAGKRNDALAAYADMAKTGARGASSASMGLADVAMYFGEYDQAIEELQKGAAADAEGKQTVRQAVKLVALADASIAVGKTNEASTLLKQALSMSRGESVVVPAARALTTLGQTRQAAELAAGLEQQVQKRRRAYAGVIRAELALRDKKPIAAIDALTASRQLADLWLVRYALGRAYLDAGSFAEAIAELETCLNRRGEAGAVYLDDVPSFRYLPPVYYWLGRAHDGLGVADSARKHYQTYVNIRGSAASDPLGADARKRIAR